MTDENKDHSGKFMTRVPVSLHAKWWLLRKARERGRQARQISLLSSGDAARFVIEVPDWK